MEERLTKKERKEQRKLEDLAKMEASKSSSKMKYLVIILAVILFLGFGVFAILSSKQKTTAPVTLSSSGWVTGNPQSKVSLTVFGDFQCPACLAYESTLNQVRAEYGKKVKIVFKHFPLKQAHPNAMSAAIAAEAAGVQGKFWQYHDKLYATQNIWSSLPNPTEEFVKYAQEEKLNVEKFKKSLQDKSLKDKINAQEDEGIRVGVGGTPSVYVNGVFLGVPSYNELKKKIDASLSSK